MILTPLRKVVLALIVLAMLILMTLAANAQQRCGKADEIFATLKIKYGERLIFSGMGLRGEGEFRIYASAEKGTWTFLGLPMSGVACVLVTGVLYLPPRVAGQAI